MGKVPFELDLKESKELTNGVSAVERIPCRGNSLCKGTET